MGRLRELVSAAWLVVESAVSWVVGWAENWAASWVGAMVDLFWWAVGRRVKVWRRRQRKCIMRIC